MQCCFLCGRPLKSPTLFLRGHPIGPVCGKSLNLFTGPARKHAKRAAPKAQSTKIERDPNTVDMFDLLGDGND